MTRIEGPVIVAHENLTHYEAIGLTLYASRREKKHCCSDSTCNVSFLAVSNVGRRLLKNLFSRKPNLFWAS